MRVVSVVAARPNFMKVAPIDRAMRAHDGLFEHLIVHTGQHYDESLSGAFLRDLGLPEPHVNLGVGSGSHAEQTAKVMLGIEPMLREAAPDLLLVVGDVNSTLAAALTARKLGIRVAHVEAGLRSGDREMPEEINRILTDAISDDLFTTEPAAAGNLAREGVAADQVHFVGNVMIDSLLAHRDKAAALRVPERLGLAGDYGVLTLHRPSNVDDVAALRRILSTLAEIARDLPVLFPAHPRTRRRLDESGLASLLAGGTQGGIGLCEPLGYLDFLGLVMGARLVLTDSGGLQEETTILGVPCVTLRESTERPVTVSEGTNRIAGTSRAGILAAAQAALAAPSTPRVPEKWDGRAAERIVDILARRDIRCRHDQAARRNHG